MRRGKRKSRSANNSPELTRKKKVSQLTSSSALTSPSTSFVSDNPFTVLSTIDNNATPDLNCNTSAPEIKTLPPPPPIFIKDVGNFASLVDDIRTTLGKQDFVCKARTNDVMISLATSDDFRKLVKHFDDVTNYDYHTFQLKEEKTFRVVIRHLHPTTPPNTIIEELQYKGFQARRVTNILHPSTRQPLSLFFVDLEPHENNATIFDLKTLYYTKIKIEEPHKKQELVQCKRCQSYGHTQNYCRHAARCVKCTGNHATEQCSKKDRSTPATCVLCGGAHPANYRGCTTHKELQRKLKEKNQYTALSTSLRPITLGPPPPPPPSVWNFPRLPPGPSAIELPPASVANPSSSTPQEALKPQSSSACATEHSTTATETAPYPRLPAYIPPPNPSNDITALLTTFLNDLKQTITPLITLLTTVINTLLPTAISNK